MGESTWCSWRGGEGGSPPRERVLAAILAIADALEAPVDALGYTGVPSRAVDLADGSAGTALLFAYLAGTSERLPELGGPERWAEAASAHLDHAIGGAASMPMQPGLLSGFTGIAWSMAHVARLLEVEIEIPESIDQGLVELVGARPWSGAYDLVSGLAGLGVYFLERLPHPLAERGLAEIVERLAELAHRDADGIAWHTPPQQLGDEERRRHPEGYYDLGVAHGLAGVIGFLSRAQAADVAERRSRELLEGAVAWLLAREHRAGERRGFPWAHIPGAEPQPARLAWCYGDPAIGVVLLRAALALGRPAWEARARSLIEDVARRPHEGSGVVDAGLCHGSAGLMHMLSRAHQAAPGPALGAAIDRWLAWTLDARVEDAADSVAGFRALTYRHGEPVWIADRGLLGGATGVALALLATVGDVEPAWDRSLLLW